MPEETKTVYQINSDGSYAGTIILSAETGDIDPLETEKAGHTVFQIPGDCVEVEPPPIPEGKRLFWRDGAWVLEDILSEAEAPEPTPPTHEEIQKTLTDAVQAHMDTKVKERGYDNIHTARLYALGTEFREEGIACVVWCDVVWRTCNNILNEVTAGQREIPTVQELIAELPELVWPE